MLNRYRFTRSPRRGNSNLNLVAAASVVVFLLVLSGDGGIECAEPDAQLLMPIAGLVKSIINTITLGSPVDLNFAAGNFVKNFASFTWRTGFPVTMPRDFFNNTQDFYNRIRTRVDESDVEKLQRKSLAKLKVDLDNVVDSIVNEVRKSPDGLYTDYLKTQVNGQSLEDACYDIGLQLKAYGVDLTNYRNIAGAILGVPLMPTVASTMVNVAKMAPKAQNSVVDFTSNIVQTPINALPGAAFGALSQVSDSAMGSIGSFRNNLQSGLTVPLSMFSQMPVQSNPAIPA